MFTPGTKVAHYRIEKKLGAGGMGDVYLAEDTKLNRKVALKFLPVQLASDEELKERFKREAQAAAALNHPNIITIHEVAEYEARPFIAMEYVEGESLKDLIAQKELSMAEVLDIALQISGGLAVAHQAGITHRDIKPQNILIGKDRRVRICDFGLAKAKKDVTLTQAGSTLGTVAYMSPEQAQGKEADHRSDIFSFGVVLYEMITGQLPFKGEHEAAVIHSIVNNTPEPLARYKREVPEKLQKIVEKAMEKDRGVRYQHADDLQADLRKPKNELESGISADQPDSLVSKERSIAVMYFENRSGEPSLEKILVDMLTTNLSRYEEIDVVSSQRLFDILKLIGKQDVETIDRHVATAIAKRAQVKTMLLGSIIGIGNKIRINTQLCDVLTGSNVGAEQVEGEKVEDIFNMVDLLTEKVIDRLGTGASGVGDQPLKIADVTTSSYEAYKCYQRGLENIWRWEYSNAAENFQRAVDIDSTFAMAHLQLVVAKGSFTAFNPLSNFSPIRESLRLAKKYSEKATDMERGFIYAYGALFNRDFERADILAADLVKQYPNEKDGAYLLSLVSWCLGKHDQGIRASERALEIDPTYANVYNNLAYHYSSNNDHRKAISTIKKYLALQPDVSNTYDSAWEIYIRAGQFDDAYHICEKALKKDAKWYGFHLRIGYIYLFGGDGDKAREKFHQVAILDPELEVPITRHLGYSYLFEGRYKEAFAEFKKAVELARNIEDAEQEIRSRFDLGKILAAQGNYPRALEEFFEARKLSPRMYDESFNPLLIIAEYLAAATVLRKGDYDEVQARAAKIKRFIEEHHYGSFYMDFYHTLLAELHLAQGKGQAAKASIGKVTGMTKTYSPRCRTLLADICRLLGNTEKAISTYKNFYNDVVTRHYFLGGDCFYYFLGRSKVNYHLGKIYEQKGEKMQAIEYCSKALDQWKNADKGLPELIDAKARLARLKEQ
jgi:non-specific serine/threonine protein kinase